MIRRLGLDLPEKRGQIKPSQRMGLEQEPQQPVKLWLLPLIGADAASLPMLLFAVWAVAALYDLYQTAETLTHLCHRRVREPRPYPIGPPNVFAMNVPMGRSQHESGSASFGISPIRFFLYIYAVDISHALYGAAAGMLIRRFGIPKAIAIPVIPALLLVLVVSALIPLEWRPSLQRPLLDLGFRPEGWLFTAVG